MHIEKMITTVDCHTAGEPTRIITGGIPHIPGKIMMEKKKWMQQKMDKVRKMLMLEPRGHQDMFGAVITAPATEDADAGVIFMDSKGYLDMCGHGSIAAVVVLLNTGMIPLADKVLIDTPAGRITANVTIENGMAAKVRICNVPAFFYDSVSIELSGLGSLKVDISYGGNFFALVNTKDLGVELILDNVDYLKRKALEIREKVNDAIKVVHPGTGEVSQVALTELYQNGSPAKNMVVFGSGQIDRSPCGTGTCAKMAWLYSKGKLGMMEPYPYMSILGTQFTGKILGETMVGAKPAILPEIEGEAFITGFHNFVMQARDPFQEGFSLSVVS
ncbi:Proline racemase [Desulfamplus magnetovallimortis]|uniref:Proline racemase n=1 Tax=Desulfamplus magnetovallimortis TaxID=1246637 RepID=A0A1W1HGX0_9BACT|nr:proline racemase family protein [Desulfamplus magnetovallimortis]SLM31724.1 Proline racemase [Desulfamplus magnetovallimortis]